MKILLVTDEMLPGGVSKHVVELANGLALRGNAVSVAATQGPMRARLLPGIVFHDLHLLRPSSFQKNWPGILRAPGILVSLLRAEKPHIMHSHKRLSDFLCSFAQQRIHTPHVSTCHNDFSNLRMLSRFGDCTLAVSNQTRENLIARFRPKGKVETVYAGIEPLLPASPDSIGQLRTNFHLPERRIIATVGHFHPRKGHDVLLRAIEARKTELARLNIHFVFLGFGAEELAIRTVIERSELREMVTLMPGDADVVALLSLAEFCVLPSLQEGLPYVLLEAASLGKPHIATRTGGCPEFILHNQTGLLVEPNNPGELATALVELAGNRERVRTMGEAARERFRQYHSYQRFLDQVLACYMELL